MASSILKSFGIVGLIIFILFVIIFAPFATIWAANTLFPTLNIGYSFDTWLATILLGVFFRGSETSIKASK